MIQIKSQRELELMRKAGHVLAGCIEHIAPYVQPGITTGELDRMAEAYIRKHDCLPACLGYRGYPATICASVNEQVVHGIPSERKLSEGDLVGVDITVSYQGYHSDMARTFAVGRIEPEAQALIDTAKDCFDTSMTVLIPGNRIGDVSAAIERLAVSRGYSVVRDLCGHGIGQDMHEDPEVPNFGREGRGVQLKPGMTLAVEPMINAGRSQVIFCDDGWTVVTADRKLSAHYENTVAITEHGPVILTQRE